MPLRHTIIFTLLLIGAAANAQETRTTYAITGSNATVTTVLKKASADQEKLMRSFLFPAVAKKLREFPMVTGVEFDGETKADITTNTYLDYWEHKRKMPVMVHLSLPTAVTLMVRVEESYRRCKSPAEKAAGVTSAVGRFQDDWGGSGSDTTVDCSLGSNVRITGPFAVYGNFASSLNVEKLLREKQTISIDVARDWSDKTSMKIDSRFAVESELFDISLMKFLDAFNVGLDSSQKVYTRNHILLGIARVLRMQNERMVE